MNAALAQIDYGLPAAPDVLVIANDPNAALRDIAVTEARCAGTSAIADALERLERGPSFDVVLLEIGDDVGRLDRDGAARLFDLLQRGAEAGRFACVAVLPFEMIDHAAARMHSPAIRLLVAPTAMERRAELATAMPERGPLRVFDGGVDAASGNSAELRDEVARIARRLAALAAAQPARPARINETAEEARIDAGFVRAIIRARRLRDQYFEAELFADPAWDMLLDLTAARLEGREVAVSSLCIAAAVPPTTALRWIKILTDTGLFVRNADRADKRRIFIALAEDAADAMLCYLAAMQRSGAAMV